LDRLRIQAYNRYRGWARLAQATGSINAQIAPSSFAEHFR
jgi:hypothetical protein